MIVLLLLHISGNHQPNTIIINYTIRMQLEAQKIIIFHVHAFLHNFTILHTKSSLFCFVIVAVFSLLKTVNQNNFSLLEELIK